ncbi:MAG: hypothetical protein LJE84_09345, partial [Gammaproteobacteria bacterium]|nr:hypothetical protein [Gammaproteobacteria bacterium]
DADRRHLFMVDPGLDQAGIPLMRNDLLRDGTYVLDTTLLVRRVNKTQQDLSAAFAHQSISRFSEMERLETLRTLAMHWRHRSLRSQRRKAEQELDLAVGLPVITTLLSDDKPLFDAFDVAASKLRGIFGSSQHAASASELRVSHWQVLDEGGGGLRLRCEDGGHDVRVGELVAWRARGSDHRWSVGVVRWARIGASNTLEVGIFTLGLNVEPLTVSAIQEDDEPAEPVPALYFPGSSEPGQAATDTLVAASGLYSPGGQLWLKRSARSNIAAATKLRLSTRAFDWFEIDRQEATRIQGPRIPGALAKLATSTAAVNKESRVSAPESLSDRRTVL